MRCCEDGGRSEWCSRDLCGGLTECDLGDRERGCFDFGDKDRGCCDLGDEERRWYVVVVCVSETETWKPTCERDVVVVMSTIAVAAVVAGLGELETRGGGGGAIDWNREK